MNIAIGDLYFAKQKKVLSNIVLKLTGKHLYMSLFLMKLHTRGQQFYWKRN